MCIATKVPSCTQSVEHGNLYLVSVARLSSLEIERQARSMGDGQYYHQISRLIGHVRWCFMSSKGFEYTGEKFNKTHSHSHSLFPFLLYYKYKVKIK